MPLSQPIRVVHDDDWTSEITEQPDGTLRVVVASAVDGMARREWAATRATIEEVIAVAYQIRLEQGGTSVPAGEEAPALDHTAPLDPPATPDPAPAPPEGADGPGL